VNHQTVFLQEELVEDMSATEEETAAKVAQETGTIILMVRPRLQVVVVLAVTWVMAALVVDILQV
jgi:hypothetical protein